MPPASRATRIPVALYHAVGPAGKSGTRLRRASEISLSTPGLDLATKLRVFQRALRGRIERRDALLDIVRAVNTSLEPPKVAETLVERAPTWVPAPCWAVVSADLSGSAVRARRSWPDARHGPAVYAIATWVMEHGQEFVTADLRQDPRVQDPFVGAVMAFPLELPRPPRRGDRGPRSPAVLSRTAFGAEHATAGTRAAGTRVGGARQRALLKRAEALSVTDDLTHLYNSRYLNMVLRKETKRASRNGRPLSLLFIDLDGFKGVNDTHGHLCGSRALVEAAAVIRGSARETDVVARFGGDEFALVLPDTGCEGAFAVGERIRERVAAHKFLAGDGLDIHLTVSVGVATLPDVAASADELMQAADKAMYRVKDAEKTAFRPPTLLSRVISVVRSRWESVTACP